MCLVVLEWTLSDSTPKNPTNAPANELANPAPAAAGPVVLGEQEVQAALVEISQQDGVLSELSRRRSGRYPLLPGTRVVVGYTPVGQTVVAVSPVVRDVSRQGLSMLYTRLIPPGTGVACLFVGPTGQSLRVSGSVLRCWHVRGSVFEIGVRFAEPAPIYQFVRCDEIGPGVGADGSGPYRQVLVALQRLEGMTRDGVALELLDEGLRDVELAIAAEREARCQGGDKRTMEIGDEEINEMPGREAA